MDLYCDKALLPEGWRERVRVQVDGNGRIAAICSDADAASALRLTGRVIPGMPNLHSHAFQRAMAGRAERFGRIDDSFWTWREQMYAQAERLDPQRLQAIAAFLYLEMLDRGYTRVCEFHYVHHQVDGQPYAPASAMADALIAAASEVGIGLTLLPVLYQRGGFDDRPLAARQRRFHHDLDAFLSLHQSLHGRSAAQGFRSGVAIHSLRAVAAGPIQALLADPRLAPGPVHLHIAEQRQEVEDCLVAHGQRPIARLYGMVAVDARFCLIHATHPDRAELAQMAASPAVVGLCPSTEGNLGDGIFPLPAFRQQGGRFGIGSDSHIGLDPREELRWLEYQARLLSGRRCLLADGEGPDVAANLWDEACRGGAQAAGAEAGGFRVGADADWIAVDEEDPALAGHQDDSLLSAWLFAPNSRPALSVGVAGREVLRAGQHPRRAAIEAAWRRVALLR